MVRLASALADRGVAVEMVVPQGGPFAAELSPQVRVVDLACTRVALTLPGLMRRLRAFRPQVLISALDYVNVVAWLAARLTDRNLRVVMTEHNTPSALIGQTPSWRGRFATRHLIPAFYPMADRVVAVSHGAREDLIRNFGIAPEHIETIENPVLSSEFARLAREAPDEPWLAPGEPPLIVTAGRLDAQKDHFLLLDAFEKLAATRAVRLLILGEGPLRAALAGEVERRGLQGRVRMPGFEANPFPTIRRAALFALSSRCEGLPTVLIEALALGTRIVSTDCPSGPAEILGCGRFGDLVPVGDSGALARAMDRALDQPLPVVPEEACRPYRTKVCADRYLTMMTRLIARQR